MREGIGARRMICFFVKTKATDDTRSIPRVSLSLSLLSLFGPFLFFSLFSPPSNSEGRESRARFVTSRCETSRWEIIHCRCFGDRVGRSWWQAKGGRVKSESPSIPF